jgi:hypothetical protein
LRWRRGRRWARATGIAFVLVCAAASIEFNWIKKKCEITLINYNILLGLT